MMMMMMIKFINVNDVIAFCLYLMKKMRRNLIKELILRLIDVVEGISANSPVIKITKPLSLLNKLFQLRFTDSWSASGRLE